MPELPCSDCTLPLGDNKMYDVTTKPHLRTGAGAYVIEKVRLTKSI